MRITFGLICLFLALVLIGCAQVVLRLSPALFPRVASSFFEECDYELAEIALPANLKLLEGLLKNDPANKTLLTTLAMGFSGYSMLFVEGKDPERASELYVRARDYGIRALGDKGKALRDPDVGKDRIHSLLKRMTAREIEPLFWTALSWQAWINLNGDNPAALGQFPAANACLERVIEVDAGYFHGMPYLLMGTSLASRPPMFGGNVGEAKACFEKALRLSHRKFLPVQYYFAKYYAVRIQDRDLFSALIEETLAGNPQELSEVCLINTAIQHEARNLGRKTEELFF